MIKKYPLNYLSDDDYNKLDNNIKNYNTKNSINKLNKLFNIYENFFVKKKYLKNNFLKKLKSNIKKECNIDFDNNTISKLLIKYHENLNHINQINLIKKCFNIELNKTIQKGGFLTNKNQQSSYTMALNIADLLLDIVGVLPNDLFTVSSNYIFGPYALVNVIMNLMRGDFEFAFYSLIGMIPSVGSIIALSSKMIHRILRAITIKDTSKDNIDYYKQILAARRVYRFVSDGANRNNLYEGNFEKRYKSSNDDEYL